jgi:hypothetical protein
LAAKDGAHQQHCGTSVIEDEGEINSGLSPLPAAIKNCVLACLMIAAGYPKNMHFLLFVIKCPPVFQGIPTLTVSFAISQVS